MSRFASTLIVCLAATVLVLLLLIPLATANAATSPAVLPDLVADPPTNPHLQTYTFSDSSSHLLLRFDGYIHNRGDGALDMRASQPVNGEMTATAQRIYDQSSGFADDSSRDPQFLFEPADGHDHWHLKNAARYSLWDSSQSAELAPAMKTGFCLGDVQRVDDNGPTQSAYSIAGNQFCQQHQPQAPNLFEGISAGWRDTYNSALAFQWVDVSAVQPGAYWLAGAVDPDDVMIESDETNDGTTFANQSSIVPGYVASPVDGGTVPNDEPSTIDLAAQTFGSPGARRLRIESAPDHGSLGQPVGGPFTGPDVTYTPDPGYLGPDSFSFSASDSASSFPTSPAHAAVSLSVAVPGPSVAISGAPSTLFTGASAQLTATVKHDAPGVVWNVDGVDGGSADAGTISASGSYVAPSAIPASGSVTIGARSASGAHAEIAVQVIDPPPPQPSPSPPPTAKRSGERPLWLPSVSRFGRLLVVRSGSDRGGVLRIAVWHGRHRLGACRGRSPAHRSFACQMRLKKSQSHVGRVRIVISLRIKRRLVAVLHRRVKIGASQSAAGGRALRALICSLTR